MNIRNSEALYRQAMVVIPGGVNNPARSFRSVGGGPPLFMSKGEGPYIWDEDGNRYVDYVMGWGPLVLGHSYPTVSHSIGKTLECGVHFGTPTRSEYELSELLVDIFPSIEMIRLVNSGSEAVVAAVRVARAFTGKRGIVKFIGCYHGWSEDMLVGSAYIPESGHSGIHLAPFNDIAQTRRVVEQNHEDLAAIIVEPVAGNMGVIAPQPGFLEGLRSLCDKFQILLIFDEVMTGFRVAYGGAQLRYGINPDITCLGKIIGGGLPIGAYGAKSQVMSVVVPLGTMYQGGTYSGNPLVASAGMATIKALSDSQMYWKRLEERALTLCSEIAELARKFDLAICTEVVGGMFAVYFCNEQPFDYESVQRCDVELFAKFFSGMLGAGIYWPPSQFEAAHISLAHDDDALDLTIQAVHRTFSSF